MNFGPRAEIVGVPFVMMGFEPEVRFWFGGGSYLALVSRYYMTYDREQNRRDRTWLNLRAVIAFWIIGADGTGFGQYLALTQKRMRSMRKQTEEREEK